MKQKHLVIGFSMLLFLACIAVSSSFAWFTDHDDAVNRVQLGKFGIDLVESTTEKDAIITDTGIQYTKPILPGVNISKNVDIENTKDLDAYIKVEIIKIWVDAQGEPVANLNPDMIEVMSIDEQRWLSIPTIEPGKEVYYLKHALSPKGSVNLFQTFELSNTINDIETYGDRYAEIQVHVTATQTLDASIQELGWNDVQIVNGELVKK